VARAASNEVLEANMCGRAAGGLQTLDDRGRSARFAGADDARQGNHNAFSHLRLELLNDKTKSV
jgi:hypothetical protein